MNRFGMWFANLMRGRYGTDNLNRFLLIIALVVIVVDIFVRWRLLDLLTIALLIYVYCRMFSRNINARYRENQKFLQLTARFRRNQTGSSDGGSYGAGGYAGAGKRSGRDKTHTIMRCPGCGDKLRVPKGAGKINITCPHCGTKFIKKV